MESAYAASFAELQVEVEQIAIKIRSAGTS